jgi:hypothetical protein
VSPPLGIYFIISKIIKRLNIIIILIIIGNGGEFIIRFSYIHFDSVAIEFYHSNFKPEDTRKFTP